MAKLSIVAGFLPWIAYWVVAGAGWPGGAAAGALAVAAAVTGWQLARRHPKPMELAALAFFSADLVVTHVLGASLGRWEPLAAALVLAALAWGSLVAGTPFTLVYAREQWPRELWSSPIFLGTNVWITAAWGLVFTLQAVVAWATLTRPASGRALSIVVPQAAVVLGIVFSVVFPRRYPRWRLARELAARDPYAWPAPVFAGRPAAERRHDVIVVGAGIGGLTAAALLARRGLDVLVLEQHYLAGGFCTSWPRVVRRGDARLRYVFDAGVHDVSGLGPRGPVRRLLSRLGIAERLEWRRVRHGYILPDLRLQVPERAEDFVALLAARFPAEASGLRAFFAEIEAVYRELYADVDVTGGVPCPPGTVDGMLAYPAAHPHAFRWMTVPFGAMLDRYFTDPRLKAVLSILTGYLSDDPAALSVGAMAPIFGYYFDGGHYPVGGSQALADALVGAVRDAGGEVRLRTAVRRIVVERGRVAGVELADGTLERAAALVSNADARRTFLELVPRDSLPADFVGRVQALAPSASAFAVFLGLDHVPDVEPLTIVQSDRGFALAVPSLVDPGLAPPGGSSVTLITLLAPAEAAAWDRRAPGYGARKRAFGDSLVALAERVLPGLGRHVVYRQDGSPATFARYAWTSGGAIYGPAVGGWRPPARSPVEGLVIAGSGVFPGAGVEAVVISGTLAADALCPSGSRASDALAPLALV